MLPSRFGQSIELIAAGYAVADRPAIGDDDRGVYDWHPVGPGRQKEGLFQPEAGCRRRPGKQNGIFGTRNREPWRVRDIKWKTLAEVSLAIVGPQRHVCPGLEHSDVAGPDAAGKVA